MSLKRNLVIGGLVTALGVGGYFGFNQFYESRNYTDIGLRSMEKPKKSPFMVFPINFEDLGKKSLHISRDKLVHVAYFARDWNGIQEIVLYQNGRDVSRSQCYGNSECYGFYITNIIPDKGEYKAIAKDLKGNKRESNTATLTVEDNESKGSLEKRIEI